MSTASTPLPSLEQAYEACRAETAEWAKTFYLGTLLMPPAKRRAIWAIYVWCRRTDELMDSPEAQDRPGSIVGSSAPGTFFPGSCAMDWIW